MEWNVGHRRYGKTQAGGLYVALQSDLLYPGAIPMHSTKEESKEAKEEHPHPAPPPGVVKVKAPKVFTVGKEYLYKTPSGCEEDSRGYGSSYAYRDIDGTTWTLTDIDEFGEYTFVPRSVEETGRTKFVVDYPSGYFKSKEDYCKKRGLNPDLV